jgi:hypothetical protein
MLANQTAGGNPPQTAGRGHHPRHRRIHVTFRPSGASGNTVAKGVVLQDGSPTNASGWFLDAVTEVLRSFHVYH